MLVADARRVAALSEVLRAADVHGALPLEEVRRVLGLPSVEAARRRVFRWRAELLPFGVKHFSTDGDERVRFDRLGVAQYLETALPTAVRVLAEQEGLEDEPDEDDEAPGDHERVRAAREALGTLKAAVENGAGVSLVERLARRAWLMGATEQEVQTVMNTSRVRQDEIEDPEEGGPAVAELEDEQVQEDETAGETADEEPVRPRRRAVSRARKPAPKATRRTTPTPCPKGCGRVLGAPGAAVNHGSQCKFKPDTGGEGSLTHPSGNVEDAIAACRRALEPFPVEVRALAAQLLVATLGGAA